MKVTKTKFGFLAALMLVLLVGAGATPVYAVPTLSFQVNGGTIVTCADGAACDLNPIAGAVTFSNGLGDTGIEGVGAEFLINVTTGLTKPVFAGSYMDLNSVNVQTGAGVNTLVMMFSEVDFSLLGVGGILNFGGTITNNGSTIQADGYYDEGNGLFALTSSIGTLGPFSGGAFSGSVGGPGPSTAPYSLTQVLTLTTTGETTFSGDFELQLVPEPASVALLGGALLLTAGFMRRKFRPNVK